MRKNKLFFFSLNFWIFFHTLLCSWNFSFTPFSSLMWNFPLLFFAFNNLLTTDRIMNYSNEWTFGDLFRASLRSTIESIERYLKFFLINLSFNSIHILTLCINKVLIDYSFAQFLKLNFNNFFWRNFIELIKFFNLRQTFSNFFF